jgi:hypothetical protein
MFLTVSDGIIVQPTTKTGSLRLGAFTTQLVHAGQVITYFDGYLLPQNLDSPAHLPGPDRPLYKLRIESSGFYVAALEHPQIGRGAASFIGHSKIFANVDFLSCGEDLPGFPRPLYLGNYAKHMQHNGQGQDPKVGAIYAVARRDIYLGEELFVCLPPNICRILGKGEIEGPMTAQVSFSDHML